ncbi:interferon gamma receptor 1 [Morone saxatilis]|uniref:interferon gamma receptor 1 n=1 Tax=Morone saxatilis TaxID=34816 RepID=UPI0015E23B67|nr:interferon gamma receptor 1 [Morone saxatilis]
MSPDGAFAALLLLLVSGVSAVIVLPPTNVSVSCQNLRVTASWEYSEQQPKTVFSIDVSGSFGKEFNTTNHQYDLSDFIWESDDHYMGKYCVTVTAIQGGTRSQPVKSKVFAFNDLKTATKCELDFPPVALIKKDSGAMISFKNPFNFYRELKLAKKKDSAFIYFTVVVPPDDEYDSKCYLDQEDCVFFLKGVEKCVVLKGRLYESPAGGQVKFREKDHICMTESTDFHMVTLVILLSVVAVVLVVVMTIICKVKAWTMDKLPDLPKPLWTVIREQGVYPTDGSTDFHQVSCADDSVRTECLSMDEEEEEEQKEEEQKEEEQKEEEQKEEQEEEDIPLDRNYDRHHFVQMDMGDGDMVDAYSAR